MAPPAPRIPVPPTRSRSLLAQSLRTVHACLDSSLFLQPEDLP